MDLAVLPGVRTFLGGKVLKPFFAYGRRLAIYMVEHGLPSRAHLILPLCVLVWADWLTGYELTFGTLYLIPLAVATLSYGWKFASLIAVLLSCFSLAEGFVQGYPFSRAFYFYYAEFSKLLSYAAFVVLLEMLRQAIQFQSQMSERDGLTGLFNRRALNKALSVELARLKRAEGALGVLFIDCDDFKAVNDSDGHAVGDKVLRTISHTLAANLRGVDCVARYGGDEFVVLLPDSDRHSILLVAEKLRGLLLHAMAREAWPVTFSIGVLVIQQTGTLDAETALHDADRAMYSAKKEGKNRIVVL
jgi:diguanylate cyclase (GGDEF)-like protein